MKEFIAFVIKEGRHITRDKRTMLILFAMPIVQMLLFGFAISTDVRNVRTVVVTSRMSPLTQQKMVELDQSEYFSLADHVHTPAEAEQLIRGQKADMAIVFSPDFDSRQGGIQLITDGADPNMAQQYANYASLVLQNASSSSPISMRLLYNPRMKSSYNFVPGIMGVLLMLICAMMTSISIVKEKERGTMEVLLVSPVRPLMIIIAKAVPYLALAFTVLICILLMSRFVLGVPLAGSLTAIILVSSLYILLALSLGLLISTIAKTQLVALIVSAMILLMPSILLSGMMFPIESMPAVLQWISAVIPPRYYISAMRKLMIMGVSVGNATQEVLVLAGMTLFFLLVALKKFNTRLE
ncbi:ABC transporter permease [Prevotella sp. KH2C16]|uniref:ABC transporter permease n=1 Tax=Prevotella sp. KH2C16 TaxID=1855325 RepID=UPI0008F1D35C|nr:ABC transporter permease [Prevotella sp. KH2C16]SFF85244.1 ABC-2 type transport system permease protein [Prevotella sp. KH2C16]